MKRDITILAPHFDDEFLGCKTLIECNPERIKNIIFITDSSIEVPYDGVSTDPNYYYLEESTTDLRASESEHWLSKFELKDLMIYFDIPDAFDYWFLSDVEGFYYKSFMKKYKQCPTDYFIDQLKKFSGDIIVSPHDTGHPAHRLAFNTCRLFINSMSNSPKWIRYYSNKYHKKRKFKEDPEKKWREFKKYYPIAARDLEKSDYKLEPEAYFLNDQSLFKELKWTM